MFKVTRILNIHATRLTVNPVSDVCITAIAKGSAKKNIIYKEKAT